MNELKELLKKYSTVGVIGNRSSGKSMLALTNLIKMREDKPSLKIACMGVEESLYTFLAENNITIIESKMDILDLQMKNTIIYIDELALFFDSRNKGKEIAKLERFFDRIDHNNCKLVVSTAREGYFNKFMCGRIGAFLVKEIEYTALVNATWLKERVCAISSISDYRLECSKDTFYTVTNKEGITTKNTYDYNESLDTKKDNIDLFAEESAEINAEEIATLDGDIEEAKKRTARYEHFPDIEYKVRK